MAGRLAGKVAIVTGAGSIGPGWGNGKAAAALFAREGARVFAVDISNDAAAETKAIIEGPGDAKNVIHVTGATGTLKSGEDGQLEKAADLYRCGYE